MYPTVKLRPERAANVTFRHPWIFSGAMENISEDISHGSLVYVADDNGRIVATGSYSARSNIAVRVFEFAKAEIDSGWFSHRIEQAEKLRHLLGYGPGSSTTGYRVAFGETDGLPGLVIDRYEDIIVIQLATAGLERLRPQIIEALIDLYHPRAIIERSDLPVRKEEGLEEVVTVHHGIDPGPIEFMENGWRFMADMIAGQKTGFYLDQKDLRREISHFASGCKALNLFSYSGAGGVAAIKGGATSVHNIDSADNALSLCRTNASLNDIAPAIFTIETADIFGWLSSRDEPAYDMIIMDPPALIKSQEDNNAGRKAYHFLNRAAMRLVKNGGFMVTSSCSTYFTKEDFAFVLRRASVQAGIELDLLKIVGQSPDHPLSVYFPESAYLKTFICRVRR
jgi:23S rRNA (cytosine1962-C5)-methyltransferase